MKQPDGGLRRIHLYTYGKKNQTSVIYQTLLPLFDDDVDLTCAMMSMQRAAHIQTQRHVPLLHIGQINKTTFIIVY